LHLRGLCAIAMYVSPLSVRLSVIRHSVLCQNGLTYLRPLDSANILVDCFLAIRNYDGINRDGALNIDGA